MPGAWILPIHRGKTTNRKDKCPPDRNNYSTHECHISMRIRSRITILHRAAFEMFRAEAFGPFCEAIFFNR
jgi:hypothetical protein